MSAEKGRLVDGYLTAEEFLNLKWSGVSTASVLDKRVDWNYGRLPLMEVVDSIGT